MKKLFTILFVLVGCRSFAQDILPITYGPVISMTSTTLTSKPDFEDQIAGAGYNFGAMVRLKIPVFYAQGEASFGSKSASVTVRDTSVNSSATFKLNGLDLSLILGIKVLGLGDLGNLRLFGGYNWNNYTDITYSIDGNEFESNNVNSNNHSVLFGIGADLSKLSLDIKYIKGFID